MKAMYQIILSAAAAILLAASCQHNEHPMGLPSGEEVSVSISAVLPGDGGAVVKSDAEPGNGSDVNRCILEVYLIGDNDAASLYGKREIVEVTGLKASFDDLNLITGQKYRFVLWADHVEAPDTEDGLAADNFYDTDAKGVGLQNVTIKDVKAYAGNDDQRDAFFYSSPEDVTVTGPADYTLDLKRPFGQLNIITTDYGLIPAAPNGLLPEQVKLTFYNIPTGINLLTGQLLENQIQKVEGTAVNIAGLGVAGNEDAKQLSFDYILAPATGQHVINELKMSFLKSDGSATGITDYTFKSLPVQRNYRTNVSGALLTDRAGLSIEVKPDFDETVTVAEQAETIEAAQLAINAGMTDIEFTKAVNGTITLPEGNKNYRIAFNEGTDGAITIKGSDFTGNVEVENNGSSSNELAISLTNGSAEVKSGTWGNIDVKTGTGFVLGEKAEGKILSTNRGKGDIEIYGKISTFSPDFMWSGTVTVFTVYGEEACKDAFASFVNDDCEKVVLGNDISITPPNTYQITGRGSHVIDLAGSKLAIKDFNANVMNVSDGAALTIQNGVISNDFTLGTNEVTIAAFVTGNNGSIEIETVEFTTVATGAMIKEGAKQANLTIRNSTIRSTKNGYAVGTNASSSTSDVVVTLENSTLQSDYGCAVLFNIDGKINVSGSDIIGGNQGLILRGGTGILSDSDVLLNCIEQNASQYANFMHNSDWASGSNVPFAAITAGNRGAGYEYPTNLTLENCEVKSIGENYYMFPAMYVWGNSAENNVAITHTNTTFYGKVIYGEDGANITVNGQQASQLTE